MSQFIDSIDPKFDNYTVLPHYDWHIIGMGKAKKNMKMPRWCAPNCEYFKEDWDHAPLCFEGCRFWTFDRHFVAAGDSVLNVIFAADIDDPSSTYSTWVSEKHLREILGERYVNRMIKRYEETFLNEQEYTVNVE
jgi:hypothetical protein